MPDVGNRDKQGDGEEGSLLFVNKKKQKNFIRWLAVPGLGGLVTGFAQGIWTKFFCFFLFTKRRILLPLPFGLACLARM